MIQQRFIHNKLFDFPRWKLIGGIVIALLTSFCWYAFFYVMREAMRIIFYWRTYHATYYEFLILTDEEVHFYNFIYALIASLFGLCACFQFWFQRAKRYNESSISYIRRNSILTDVAGVNAIFLHWFARLAFVFAGLGGLLLASCDFQLYPAWNFFWVLLIPVLFMEMWKTIRKVAFRESRRWMLFSVVGIVVWSFILSRIQIVDYNEINRAYINSSITRKYQIEYPESEYYRMIEDRSLMMDIHLCFPVRAAMDTLPKVFVNQNESGFDHLHEKIEEMFEKVYGEWNKRLVTAVLHIDRQMPVKYVKILQKHLSCSESRKIGYRIFPADQGLCARSTHYAIIRMLPPCSNPETTLEFLQWINTEGHEQLYVQLTSTGLYINGKLHNWWDIDRIVRDFVGKHPNYLIALSVDDDCVYEDYVRIYSTLFKTFSGIRNDLSILKYKKVFDDLLSDQQDEIRTVFPFAIYEPIHISN